MFDGTGEPWGLPPERPRNLEPLDPAALAVPVIVGSAFWTGVIIGTLVSLPFWAGATVGMWMLCRPN